ncbi:helix-turn-helix domain-containing protein [Paenibacillus sp. LHD-117]|uniref:helix-turn-helix domain-containing protein n=1 Tax=Paenibacillus sp. LHD-117 TaxID=3071412 RepID=UPI0027E1455F|nr:helix-turn-helix domain-containing protein [Paenibacillus sp. LHD-117]MDQ6420163.1 helix-turn-helix domain-containing protein [Paenibacillus sp. LHD-117]
MKLAKNRRHVKAIGVLSIVLFLLVSSSIFFTYTIFNGQLKQQLIDTNMELLGQVEHKLELTLKHIDKSTIQLLKNEDVVRFYNYELNEQGTKNNQIRVSNLITGAIQSMDYIFTIDLYSYDKQRLVSGNILTEKDLSGDFQWVSQFEQYDGFFEWITTRKVMINRSQYPVYRNVVTLVRTYPLIHSAGSRKGAIAVNIKEDSLFGLIQNTAETDEGQTFIVDREGVVVLHLDNGKLGKDISEFPYIGTLLNDPEGSGHFIADVDQTTSSVFYVDAAYTGWHIVRVVPESQFSKPLALFRNGLAVLAVVLFVVATSSAAVIGRWTFKPMNRFAQSMRNRLTDSPKPSMKKYTDEFHYFESTVQDIMDDRNQLHRQVVESKPLLKWRLMSDLLSGQIKNQAMLQPYMDMLNITSFGSRYVVMSVEFDNKGQISSPRDLKLYAYALCNVAEELMNAESQGIAAELDDGKCAVIMSFEDEDDRERHFMRAVAVADLMKEFVQEYLGRTITIGIGEPVEQLGEIRRSYKQSLEALSYKLVMGGNSIITREDITGDPSPQFYKLFGMTDGIMASVKLSDADKMYAQVRKWFESIAEQSVPSEMIMQSVVQCLMKAATAAAEIGVDTEGVFPEQSLVDMLNQYERLEQLEQFTLGALDRLIVRIKEKRSSREKNGVIDKAMQYIQEHYMRSDLSLNLLASEFHISVSHLSKLFKEQKECNFIDYVMEIRMGHAKERLASTEDKIRDIAEQVGYSNVNSFVRIFKKMTGLTPTEYREKARMGG